jgi:hypothetical protein
MLLAYGVSHKAASLRSEVTPRELDANSSWRFADGAYPRAFALDPRCASIPKKARRVANSE